MSYIQNTERQLRDMLRDLAAIPVDSRESDEIARFIRGKVAESYRNGMEAAQRIRAEQRTVVREARRPRSR